MQHFGANWPTHYNHTNRSDWISQLCLGVAPRAGPTLKVTSWKTCARTLGARQRRLGTAHLQ
ncbi:hypothetical protein BIW11_02775 [Tropilaelaps mercedesae]|uniref:Uncharacterized protein n=1 Tax=Tropilaelaps mercedesae TaxID=418985 RepID=A0A1V9XXI4_9ACAR|nr:hypothetical protein BIW11_02775 [Tropilaelaps mercedesae]